MAVTTIVQVEKGKSITLKLEGGLEVMVVAQCELDPTAGQKLDDVTLKIPIGASGGVSVRGMVPSEQRLTAVGALDLTAIGTKEAISSDQAIVFQVP